MVVNRRQRYINGTSMGVHGTPMNVKDKKGPHEESPNSEMSMNVKDKKGLHETTRNLGSYGHCNAGQKITSSAFFPPEMARQQLADDNDDETTGACTINRPLITMHD